jgi:hypothetical protein
MSALTVVSALALLAPAAGPPKAHPWVVNVGMTGEQVGARTDELRARGYRPVGISAYNVVQANRFAVVYEKGNGPAWHMSWGQTADQFLRLAQDLGARGYVPASLSGCNLVGIQRLSAVWVRGEGREFTYGLRADELVGAVNRMKARGFRPAKISSYMADTFTCYAVVWRKADGVPWELRYGLTAQGFQDALDAMSVRGYRPVSASGNETVGVLRFCAIWEKRGGPAWQLRFGQSEQGLLDLANSMSSQGYRPTSVTAYDTGSAGRFVSIWEKDVPGPSVPSTFGGYHYGYGGGGYSRSW